MDCQGNALLAQVESWHKFWPSKALLAQFQMETKSCKEQLELTAAPLGRVVWIKPLHKKECDLPSVPKLHKPREKVKLRLLVN